MNPIFDGIVSPDGKLVLDKSQVFKDYLRGLTGKRIQLTVEKIKRNRSTSQNAYYWSVVVKLIAQHTGHDPEMIHELLKQQFAPKWHMPALGGAGIPTSTARMDTLVFCDYTERCRIWANEFFGLQIPLPGEVQSD